MNIGEERVEVPLTYETKGRFQKVMRKANLGIQAISGVHFLTCFSPKVVEANVLVKRSNGKPDNIAKWAKLARLDRWLANQFPWFSAAIVGVAVKR
jgi:hypothetical protein